MWRVTWLAMARATRLPVNMECVLVLKIIRVTADTSLLSFRFGFPGLFRFYTLCAPCIDPIEKINVIFYESKWEVICGIEFNKDENLPRRGGLP